ncbi:MAG: VOC family protein, partial [Chloroflexota bacterium]
SRAFRAAFGESPSQFRKRVNQTKEQKNMFQPTITFVKIPVTDFNRATAYYRDVIGLEEEFAVEAYGWAQYKTGNIPLCLYVTGQGGGDGVPGHEAGFHLAVENIQEYFAAFQQRGGQFASEIVGSADGGFFFMLQDPDGNRFKIVQQVAP